MNAVDLPDVIPIFPLPGALLLPRARLPLHIFEPRYLAMFDDVIKTSERLIGMIQPVGADRLQRIGCAGRIVSFSETDDGRYMISLRGISRFRIQSEQEGFTPYRRCAVSWAGFDRDLEAEETDPKLDRASLGRLVNRYFTAEGLETDWDALDQASDEVLINAVSMMSPLAAEDKQALLEAPSLPTRRETLEALLEFALHGGEQKDRMQ